MEGLPLLVLERVCEYLDDHSATRKSLQAFALTSRCLYAAAATQIFSQLEIRICDPDELYECLRRGREISAAGQNCHVRRLKISWGLADAKMNGKLDEDDDCGWNSSLYTGMHPFCRPSRASTRSNGGCSLVNNPKEWAALGHFVRLFSGLQDLIWAAGKCVPPAVLSAVSERKCRLHHHNFHLPSLVYSRDSVQSVSPEDYTLCTSPELFSVVFEFCSFGDHGFLDYNGEAVMQMLFGLAPNLAHMLVVTKRALGDMLPHQTWELGRPAWKGFYLENIDQGECPQAAGPGRLQSLVFEAYAPGGIEQWARRTDLSKLRCLVIKWKGNGAALARIASRGDLGSLQSLDLLPSYGENDESEEL